MSGAEQGADLAEAIGRLAGTGCLLVALDFDGTLAPHVDDPSAVEIVPIAKEALDRLHDLPDTHVAFISGRALADLAAVSMAAGGILLIGSHGVEVRLNENESLLTLDESEQSLLAELDSRLQEIADNYDGVVQERKPAGRVVHTRRAEPAVAVRAQREAREIAASLGDAVIIREGKNIVEFAVRAENKGDGIRRLREAVGASRVLFAGDDVTDEDGFLVLERGDVGIKVGDGESAARFRVTDPQQLGDMLLSLAEQRQAR